MFPNDSLNLSDFQVIVKSKYICIQTYHMCKHCYQNPLKYCNTHGVVLAVSARGVANHLIIVLYQELGSQGNARDFFRCQACSDIGIGGR